MKTRPNCVLRSRFVKGSFNSHLRATTFRTILACSNAAMLALLINSPAHATTFYWDNSSGNNASGNSTNWATTLAGGINPAQAPNSITDDVYFNISTFNANQIMGLNGSRVYLGITFNSTGTTNIENHTTNGLSNTLTIGSDGITVNNGAGAVSLGVLSGRGTMTYKLAENQSWTNNSSNVLTIGGGSISNAGNVTPYTLTLGGSGAGGISIGNQILDGGTTGTTEVAVNNTGGGTTTLSSSGSLYTGGTTVNRGTLTLASTATLGAATGALKVNNTNTGPATASVLNLATGADITTGSLSGTIALAGSGTNTVTINTQASRTFTVNQTTAGTYDGVIAGAGGFTLGSLSTNTLIFTGTNTYTGETRIDSGVLRLSGNGTISSSSNVTINTVGSDVANFNIRNTVGWVYSGAITGDGTGQINLNSGTDAKLTGNISGVSVINANSEFTDTTLSGNISGVSTDVKVQSGNNGSIGAVLRLSGTNTYGGVTTVANFGTLILNGDNSLAIGNVTISSGGTLRGIGTVGGATSLASNAHLAAGSTSAVGNVGTETFSSSLGFDSGSIFDWDINSGLSDGAYDKIVSSTLSVTSGAKFAVNSDVSFSDTFWQRNHLWTDVFNKNFIGFAVSDFLYSVNGSTTTTPDSSTVGFFTNNGTSLEWTAVPEPTSALAGLLITAGLLRRRRI